MKYAAEEVITEEDLREAYDEGYGQGQLDAEREAQYSQQYETEFPWFRLVNVLPDRSQPFTAQHDSARGCFVIRQGHLEFDLYPNACIIRSQS